MGIGAGAGGAGVLQTSGNAIVTPLLEACTTLIMLTPTVTGMGASLLRPTLRLRQSGAAGDLDGVQIVRAVLERQMGAPEELQTALVGLDDDRIQRRAQEDVLLLPAN